MLLTIEGKGTLRTENPLFALLHRSPIRVKHVGEGVNNTRDDPIATPGVHRRRARPERRKASGAALNSQAARRALGILLYLRDAFPGFPWVFPLLREGLEPVNQIDQEGEPG